MAKELLRSSMEISPYGDIRFFSPFRPDHIILFDSSNNKRMDFYPPPKKKLKKNLKKYCRKKKYLYLCNEQKTSKTNEKF